MFYFLHIWGQMQSPQRKHDTVYLINSSSLLWIIFVLFPFFASSKKTDLSWWLTLCMFWTERFKRVTDRGETLTGGDIVSDPCIFTVPLAVFHIKKFKQSVKRNLSQVSAQLLEVICCRDQISAWLRGSLMVLQSQITHYLIEGGVTGKLRKVTKKSDWIHNFFFSSFSSNISQSLLKHWYICNSCHYRTRRSSTGDVLRNKKRATFIFQKFLIAAMFSALIYRLLSSAATYTADKFS